MRVMKILLCGLMLALPVLAEEAEDRQTATSLHYVSHELDTRQNKLSTGTNVALTYTNAAGGVQQRTVKENLTGGTTDTSLPQVNAVNTGLNTKQNDIAPIDDHTAVTYTEDVGTIGQKGIYQDTGTYAAQSDNLIDAKTFNAALKNALDTEFVCADRPDAHAPGTNTCWLWEIHSATENSSTKNLLEPSFMDNSTYGTVTVYGRTINHAKILPTENGKTYTLSAKLTCPQGKEFYYYLAEILPDGTLINGSTNNSQCRYMWNSVNGGTFNQTPRTCTFNARDNATYVVYFVNALYAENLTLTEYQMELGSTATPYVPYGNLYIPQNQQ